MASPPSRSPLLAVSSGEDPYVAKQNAALSLLALAILALAEINENVAHVISAPIPFFSSPPTMFNSSGVTSVIKV